MFTSSAAVVGHNGSGGDLSITGSSSSASATVGVGPNGTEYTAEVSMVNTTADIRNDTVMDVTYSNDENASINFTGLMEVPTPCHNIDHQLERKENNTYVLNVLDVRESKVGESVCVQQLTMIEYEGSFESKEPFKLEIQHNKSEIKTLEHPKFNGKKDSSSEKDSKKEGLISGLVRFLSPFF